MPIVTVLPAVEVPRPARTLRLGDVITRDPDTGQHVRWHLLSDGTTHGPGGRRIWFLAATDGQYGAQRHISFGIDEQLHSEKGTTR